MCRNKSRDNECQTRIVALEPALRSGDRLWLMNCCYIEAAEELFDRCLGVLQDTPFMVLDVR